MTAVSPDTAHLVERRATGEAKRTERRGRDRRKATSRINRIAPRTSRLQIVGALATAVSVSVAILTLMGMAVLGLDVSMAVGEAMGLMLGLSVLILVMGSIEQRLIEVRLELMMLNGGRRKADRRSGDERRA